MLWFTVTRGSVAVHLATASRKHLCHFPALAAGNLHAAAGLCSESFSNSHIWTAAQTKQAI